MFGNRCFIYIYFNSILGPVLPAALDHKKLFSLWIGQPRQHNAAGR